MENIKIQRLIVLTICVMIIVCLYLLRIGRIYGGAVNANTYLFTITLPIVFAVNIWRFFKGKLLEKPYQHKMNIVILILAVVCILVISRILIKNPYQLDFIVLAVMNLVLMPFMLSDIFLRKAKPAKTNETNMIEVSVGYICIYLLIAITVQVYILILNPLTIAEAKQIVSQTYGNDTYLYSNAFTRRSEQEQNPLGIYYFYSRADLLSSQYSATHTSLEVSVLDGTIVEKK